jgi:hypothetical protein
MLQENKLMKKSEAYIVKRLVFVGGDENRDGDVRLQN